MVMTYKRMLTARPYGLIIAGLPAPAGGSPSRSGVLLLDPLSPSYSSFSIPKSLISLDPTYSLIDVNLYSLYFYAILNLTVAYESMLSKLLKKTEKPNFDIKKCRELKILPPKNPYAEHVEELLIRIDRRRATKDGRAIPPGPPKRKTKDAIAVLNGYGHRCACCGCIERAFLTIDHVKNNGTYERIVLKRNGAKFHKFIIENNFPQDYQLLCFNCNITKNWRGGCPHGWPTEWKVAYERNPA